MEVYYTDEVETHALSGMHLSIGYGEYVSINGPSGCRKSTLLPIIGLPDMPGGGSCHLDGRRVDGPAFVECAWLRNNEIGFIQEILIRSMVE